MGFCAAGRGMWLLVLAACALLASMALCSCSSPASDGDGGTDTDSVPSEESLIDTLHSFGYGQLSPDLQRTYRQILAGLLSNSASIDVECGDADEVSVIYNYVLDDHPELFWYSGTGSLETDVLGRHVLVPGRLMELDEEGTCSRQIEEVASQWEATLPEGASDYDIAKSAYEFVIARTSYDEDAYASHQAGNSLAGDDSTTIVGVFIDGSAVCDGYASAFQYLMQREGIYCGLVTGTATGAGKGTSQHAWDLVLLDGQYYYVDPTWGDPTYSGADDVWDDGVSYDYLCITTEELLVNHVPASSYTLPECTSHACDWYVLAGRYFDAYDRGAVIAMLAAAYDAGEGGASFKFSNEAAYASAVTDLFDDSGIADLLDAAGTYESDGTPFHYSYIADPGLYTVKIRW